MARTTRLAGGLLAAALPVFLQAVATGAGEVPAPLPSPRDLAAFTPASLLAPGETEFVLFQNVYTQTRYFDSAGKRRDVGGRATYSSTEVAWSRGITSRLTFGLDLSVRSVRDDAARQRDPPAETDRRTALAWIAPRLEMAPWRSHPSLSLETSLRIPTARHLDGADGEDVDDQPEAPFLDTGDPTVVVRLRTDHGAGRRAYLYAELGDELRVDENGPDGASTPLLLIGHAVPSDRWTLVAPLGVTPYWGGAANGDWSSRMGLGAKFRPEAGWEVETLVTIFPAGRNQGAGAAFSLGVRLVH